MNLGELVASLGADFGPLKSDLSRADSMFRKYANTTESTLRKVGKSVMSLKTGVVALAGAFAMREIIHVVDDLTLLEGRLKLVTKNAQDLTNVQRELLDISNRTRNSYSATANLYARIGRSVEELGTSQKDLLQVTETINKALIVSGASATEASAALIQLSQGLASGTLRGDELRSVLEQTPRLAKAIADGMGIAIGQLRIYGQEGKLNAKTVMDALLKQKKVIDEEFKSMPVTISQAWTVFRNELDEGIKKLSDYGSFAESIAGAIMKLADAVRWIVESGYLQTLADQFGLIWDAASALFVGFGDTIGKMEDLQKEAEKTAKVLGGLNETMQARTSWDELLSGIQKFGEVILQSVTFIAKVLGRFIATALGDIYEMVKGVWNMFGALSRGAYYAITLQWTKAEEERKKFFDSAKTGFGQLEVNWQAMASGMTEDWHKFIADVTGETAMLDKINRALKNVTVLGQEGGKDPKKAVISDYQKLINTLEDQLSTLKKYKGEVKELSAVEKAWNMVKKLDVKVTDDQFKAVLALVTAIEKEKNARKTSQAELSAREKMYADMANLRLDDYDLSLALLNEEKRQYDTLTDDEALKARWFYNELDKLQRLQVRRHGTMIDAMVVAWKDWSEALQSSSEIAYDKTIELLDEMKDGFSDTIESMLEDGVMNFDDFKDRVVAIIRRMIAEIATQKIIIPIVTDMAGGMLSGLGINLGGSIAQLTGGGGTGGMLGTVFGGSGLSKVGGWLSSGVNKLGGWLGFGAQSSALPADIATGMSTNIDWVNGMSTGDLAGIQPFNGMSTGAPATGTSALAQQPSFFSKAGEMIGKYAPYLAAGTSAYSGYQNLMGGNEAQASYDFQKTAGWGATIASGNPFMAIWPLAMELGQMVGGEGWASSSLGNPMYNMGNWVEDQLGTSLSYLFDPGRAFMDLLGGAKIPTVRGGFSAETGAGFDILNNPEINAEAMFNYQDKWQTEMQDSVIQSINDALGPIMENTSSALKDFIQAGIITEDDIPEDFMKIDPKEFYVTGLKHTSEEFASLVNNTLTNWAETLTEEAKDFFQDATMKFVKESMANIDLSSLVKEHPIKKLYEELLDDSITDLDTYIQKAQEFASAFNLIQTAIASVHAEAESMANPITGLAKTLQDINARFAEMAGELDSIGASAKEFLKLESERRAVIKMTSTAPFEQIQGNIEQGRIDKALSGFDINQWKTLFEYVWTGLDNLDTASETYYDDALAILNDQLTASEKIASLQQEQVDLANKTSDGMKDLADSLLFNEKLSPVDSVEKYVLKFYSLASQAMNNPDIGTASEAAQELQSFIPDYLQFMQVASGNYTETFNGVQSILDSISKRFENIASKPNDISSLQDEVTSRSQDIIDAINEQNIVLDWGQIPEGLDWDSLYQDFVEQLGPGGVLDFTQYVTSVNLNDYVTPAEIPTGVQQNNNVVVVGGGESGALTDDEIAQLLSELQNISPPSLPGYQHGGKIDVPGLYQGAENGTEYVVPTNPSDSARFLQSIGLDPDRIAERIADKIPSQGQSHVGPMTLQLILNDELISEKIWDMVKYNTEFVELGRKRFGNGRI